MASSVKILCPKCFRIRPREGHHIFPRTNFGPQPKGPLLYLCHNCHRQLDAIVLCPSLTKRQILELTREFIGVEE